MSSLDHFLALKISLLKQSDLDGKAWVDTLHTIRLTGSSFDIGLGAERLH